MTTSDRLSIRPGVGILSVLRHLNYKPWFAIAEFVDNSLQSYLQNRARLRDLHGDDFKLKVEVEIERSDGMRLRVRDNAAGIAEGDYARAFRAAELPSDRSGLSEFGMGMKSAACWFSNNWKVRTTALGEDIERTISFNIDRIVQDNIEELEIVDVPANKKHHYTEITLIDPFDKLQTRTGGKIKDHLASIYRVFLREGEIELFFVRDGNSERLNYEEPDVLTYPYYRDPEGPPITWYKEFSFDFGLGLRASGFAALRAVASTATAGFALFRRQRLIEGSFDDPYRPVEIFGSGNTYRKQRLIGEIHLEGFDVSHTKDGFQWAEHEQPFLEILRAELETQDLPMLTQAEGFRARVAARELQGEAEKATDHVAESIQKDIPPVLEKLADEPSDSAALPESVPPASQSVRREIELSHRGTVWRVSIELAMDPSLEDWIAVSDRPATKEACREITVRLSLLHPFMQRYCRPESFEIEALTRVAAALGLAEITARDSGVRQYGTIRRNVNQLLRNALSKP